MTPEQERYLKYGQAYLRQARKDDPGSVMTNTASAQKTIATRRAMYGNATVSQQGMKNIKGANA